MQKQQNRPQNHAPKKVFAVHYRASSSEATKRKVEDESQSGLCREQNVTVEVQIVKTDVGTVEEEIN